jgi:hypothetical protein
VIGQVSLSVPRGVTPPALAGLLGLLEVGEQLDGALVERAARPR